LLREIKPQSTYNQIIVNLNSPKLPAVKIHGQFVTAICHELLNNAVEALTKQAPKKLRQLNLEILESELE
jgi:hypothetical protein